MIEPEDLRIGDLVMISHGCMFPKGTMCAVTQINPDKEFGYKKGVVTLSAINDNDDGPWGTWCCNVDGIPITPEILNKNGFQEEVVGEYYAKSLDNEEDYLARDLIVLPNSGSWNVFIEHCSLQGDVLLRKVQYVHELQHILWVLGLDAELKIK